MSDDYESVPLDDAGTVQVRYEPAGRIEPMPYSDEPQLNNRQRVREPRQGKVWCDCDQALVHEGERCRVCRQRNRQRRRNKR